VNALQLSFDLVGPQLVLYRRYKSHLEPFKLKRVETKMMGIIHTRGSRLSTLNQRWRQGGFEINLFPAHRDGFDKALKLLDPNSKNFKPISEAHIVKLDKHIDDPDELELWVMMQLELGATKRIK
jgi:hypothetical protein